MLALVLVLSGLLILLPMGFLRRNANSTEPAERGFKVSVFAYFTFLGLAFLFVEIPLIQAWILLLGQPIYAFTTVVLVLMVFSGLGSSLAQAEWLPKKRAFGALVILSSLTPLGIGPLTDGALAWPLFARVGVALIALAPLGVLMGLPFPMGLAWLQRKAPHFTPWAWAVNGCASVVASVLAAILTLSYGFPLVLWLGAGSYLGAWITFQSVEAAS